MDVNAVVHANVHTERHIWEAEERNPKEPSVQVFHFEAFSSARICLIGLGLPTVTMK